MLVRLKKQIGSWLPGLEKDLRDEVAERLIAEGKAESVQVRNKRLKTLADVVEESKANADRQRLEDLAAQGGAATAAAVRTKAKR